MNNYVYVEAKAANTFECGTGAQRCLGTVRSQGTTNIICTYLAAVYYFKTVNSWLVDRVVVLPLLINSASTNFCFHCINF